MPSYTASLRLVQPATGEYSGTWGTEVNNGLTALVDASIAGTSSITMTAANFTLTTANGASDQSRAMFLVLEGTPGASFAVIVPSVSKLYFVTNNTGFAQTVRTSGTGISVPNGASMTLRCDGTNVVVAQNYFLFTSGSAALPSVAFSGDADTGMWSPAANTVALSTNGTERLRLDSAGGVTVGSASTAAGRIDSVTNGYAAFVARASTSGVNQTVDALKATDSVVGQFANAVYSANSHIWNYAGATEGMRLDSGGNLGIGATTPGAKLDVSGTGSTYVQVRSSNAGTGSGYYTNNATRSWLIGAGASSGNSNLEFRDVTGSTTRMSIDTSGNLLIGTTTANATLTVNGNVVWNTGVNFAGAVGNAAWTTAFGAQNINASIQASHSIAGANIYAISDVRLKSNIKPIPSGLAFVNEVDAVQFTWKESGIEDTGFIAQDLLKKGFGHLVSAIPDGAMKELVHDDGNVSPAGSRFVVKYDSVVPILCKAIQEQQALIASLTARVAALEKA